MYNISTDRYTHGFIVFTHKLPVAYNIDSLNRKQESSSQMRLLLSPRLSPGKSITEVRLVVPGRKLANWVI